jgi:ketosteroid isomerase-like protein
MRMKALAAVVAIGVAVVAYLAFFGKSDEDQIRETVARLSRVVEIKDNGGNPLFAAVRVRDELKQVLTDDVHVTIPELGGGRQGRDGIADAAAQAQLMFSSAQVDLRHVEIKLEPGAPTAQVSAEARLTGTRRGGETRRDDRNVDFLLRKEDGKWKIRSVTVWSPP